MKVSNLKEIVVSVGTAAYASRVEDPRLRFNLFLSSLGLELQKAFRESIKADAEERSKEAERQRIAYQRSHPQNKLSH